MKFWLVFVPIFVFCSEIKLIFLGDIMTHNFQLNQAKTSDGYDFSSQFKEISPFLKSADFVVGNYESTSDDKRQISAYPVFNTPPQIFKALKEVGFGGLSTSNNHFLDSGILGAKTTIKLLKLQGLESFGSGEKKILIKDIKGVKFGFLAYSYGFNGRDKTYLEKHKNFINLLDEVKIKNDITKLKKLVDFVVVYPHWGEEYSQKANIFQIKLAKNLAKFGADFIIGSHPHTTQEAVYYDKYKSLVAFSLGNFISNQRFETLQNYFVERGLAVEIKIIDKKISYIKFHPLWVGKIDKKIQVFLAKDYANKRSPIHKNKRAKKAYFDTLQNLNLKIINL